MRLDGVIGSGVDHGEAGGDLVSVRCTASGEIVVGESPRDGLRFPGWRTVGWW